jgi:hypothetical protein
MEVLAQWKLGILAPHWAEHAQFGYGEPRFVFYPPISWMLGAALGAILPWSVVPGVFIWIALTLSGATMFRLARAYFSRSDATAAALLYAANPYFMVNIYWRSAMAELLAGALFPLMVYQLLRLEQERLRGVPPLALILAAAWLTNVPAAIMLCYSLALFVVVLAILHKSVWLVWFGGLATAIGCGLAALYLLPVAHEQTWIDLGQALSPGVRPSDNFLFTVIANVDHNHFNRLVSSVALAAIAVLAAAAWRSRKNGDRLLWWALVVWGLAAAILMLPVTLPLWNHLPKLRFIQLPWRLLVCMNAGLAVLVVLGWRRNWQRAVIYLAMLFVMLWTGLHTQMPWWDQTDDVAEMADNQATGAGYEGMEEYVPAGGNMHYMKPGAPAVQFQSQDSASPAAQIAITRWSPTEKEFTATTDQPGSLILRLADYRAWKVEVNGTVVQPSAQMPAGQMRIAVSSGLSRVVIRWHQDWDQKAGWAISLFAAMVWIGTWRISKTNLPEQRKR